MTSRLPRPGFGLQVAVGMGAGLLLGLVARGAGGGALGDGLHMAGQLFVQLLRALVPPLVFTAIVGSVAALRDLDGAGRLVARTLGWFALTSLAAVLIGLLLGTLLQPGLRAGALPPAAAPATTGSWLDFLHGLVPANWLGIEAATKLAPAAAGAAGGGAGAGATATTALSFNVLQIIVAAVAVGAAAVRVGRAGEPFLALNASALAVLRRLLRWVVALTPLGSAALVGDAAARYGWATLGSLGAFAAAVYAGLALVLLGVYPALLLAHGLSPRRFLRAAWPAMQLGFVLRSSVGTLPVTEACAEAAGVPRAYAAFAVPLGATTEMDGCAAVYPAVAALFVAQFFGVALGWGDYALIVLVSVLGSAATAGLTGATVMLTLTLSTLGLPLEGAGLLLAVDPILDMGRTAVNVAGQLLVPVLVARAEGLLVPSASASAPAAALAPTP